MRSGGDPHSASVGAGHAVAVQNLAENAMMLLMIGVYTLRTLASASVITLAAGFGGFMPLAIVSLWPYRAKKQHGRTR